MADSHGLSTKGWWLKHADGALDTVLHFESMVPAVQSYCIQGGIEQAVADDQTVIGITKEAVVIVKASFAVDTTEVADKYYLVNAGTSGATDATVASKTAADTLTAFRPATLTLGATVSVPAGAGLTFKRTTLGAAATCMAGEVMIEVAPDITHQLTPLGEAPTSITISRVTFIPDTAFNSGALYLVNKGTAGTDDSTVASKVAAALVAAVPYTLTLGSGDTLRYTDGQVMAFKRLTASGDKTMPAGKVVVESDLTYA